MNDRFKKGHFGRFATKPEVKDSAIGLEGIDYFRSQTLKIYSLDLAEIPREVEQTALDMLIGYLEQYVRDNKRTIDASHNLPIHITAENIYQAEERLPFVRSELNRKYRGNPELRGDEIRYYVQALAYSASNIPNVFVFPRENTQ